MKTTFKMIATDLDRTLLWDDETLTPATVEAIRRVRKAGLLFVVATARSLYSTMLVAREISPDAIIHTGGAYAVVGDEVIYRAVLSAEDTEAAAMTCLASPVVDHIRVCGEVEDITTNPTVEVGKKEFFHYRRVSDEEIPAVFRQAATKITVCAEDADKAATLFEGDSRYTFTPSRNTRSFGHKLSHPAATKEAALAFIAEHFGVTCDDIIAFGDDLADVGMLSLCGLGVAVENAIPEVKAVANKVCPPAYEDGVARFLQAHDII